MPQPSTPLLSVTRSNATLIVSWPLPASGWVLLQSAALLTPAQTVWSQVSFPYETNATHIFISLPTPPGNNFYRLRKL